MATELPFFQADDVTFGSTINLTLLPFARTGSGTLTVSVNGGEPQIVSSETFSPAVVKGANTFAFAYAGDGSAVLQRFAHFNGTLLIFR